MFKEFHMRFFTTETERGKKDKDGKATITYNIGSTELFSLIEIMGHKDMISEEVMKEEVFPIMGVSKKIDALDGILSTETKIAD